jgi:hypothetical protein
MPTSCSRPALRSSSSGSGLDGHASSPLTSSDEPPGSAPDHPICLVDAHPAGPCSTGSGSAPQPVRSAAARRVHHGVRRGELQPRGGMALSLHVPPRPSQAPVAGRGLPPPARDRRPAVGAAGDNGPSTRKRGSPSRGYRGRRARLRAAPPPVARRAGHTPCPRVRRAIASLGEGLHLKLPRRAGPRLRISLAWNGPCRSWSAGRPVAPTPARGWPSRWRHGTDPPTTARHGTRLPPRTRASRRRVVPEG